MKNAKKFLRENPTESKAVAAKIFNVNARSLSAFIQSGSGAKNEEHNKMLQDHEINALDDFIRMKRDDVHAKDVAARKTEKARIKQIKEMRKNRLFISVELLQFIHDPEVE
jgi:hypothetical protein